MKKFTKEDYGNLSIAKFNDYRKNPRIVIKAAQIDVPFQVESLEGLINGKANDFLLMGINGELYPCDQNIFYQTYLDVDCCYINDLMKQNEELNNSNIYLQNQIKLLEDKYDYIKDYLYDLIDEDIFIEAFGEDE